MSQSISGQKRIEKVLAFGVPDGTPAFDQGGDALVNAVGMAGQRPPRSKIASLRCAPKNDKRTSSITEKNFPTHLSGSSLRDPTGITVPF